MADSSERDVTRPRAELRAPASARFELRSLCLFAAPGAAILALDVASRHAQLARLDAAHALGYAASALLSLVLWGSLFREGLVARGASRWIGRVTFVGLAAWIVGTEASFRSTWGTYLSQDGMLDHERASGALTGGFTADRHAVLVVAVAAAAGIFLCAGRAALARRRAADRVPPAAPARVRWLPLLLFSGSLFLPVSYREVQSTTPDIIYLSGVGSWLAWRASDHPEAHLARMQPRRVAPLAAMAATPRRQRNVILVLQESQRADVTCIAYDPACRLATRASNHAAPERTPFLQARANASSTLISTSVLLTGLPPTAARSDALGAPNLWEIARAGGHETAYFGAQHLMFANMYLLVDGLGRRVVATDLDPVAHFWVGATDAELADHVLRELPTLTEPFFAVVHASNIHAPRLYDPEHAPFQPSADDKGDRDAYINFYKNVVYLSDLAVGRIIEGVRRMPAGERTILVYTSDHGEAYWEHGQGCDHSCTVHEEEIRVPLWIDAPPETLEATEREALASRRDDLVWHIDIAPTVLDLLGLWDAPELAPHRARMPGEPLTRPRGAARAPVPLSTVSWTWESRSPSFGLMDGSLKVMARSGSDAFECFDVATDPGEERPLASGCETLLARTYDLFKVLPKDFPGLKRSAGWGEPGVPWTGETDGPHAAAVRARRVAPN